MESGRECVFIKIWIFDTKIAVPMLDDKVFKTVVEAAPLVSVDFIVERNNKFLLGRRINKPAQNYFFTVGGRVNKNETIKNAMSRIAKDELNIELFGSISPRGVKLNPRFMGVFEHFYDDGIYEKVSTHYINLAYKLKVGNVLNLPTKQHNQYQWFSIDKLLESEQVHKNVKDYFKD